MIYTSARNIIYVHYNNTKKLQTLKLQTWEAIWDTSAAVSRGVEHLVPVAEVFLLAPCNIHHTPKKIINASKTFYLHNTLVKIKYLTVKKLNEHTIFH